MKPIQERNEQFTLCETYVITHSNNKTYRFSKGQKIGTTILSFIILFSCLYLYIVSKEISVFGLLPLYLAFLGVIFRQIVKSRPSFVALCKNGILFIDFDVEKNRIELQKHRLAIPVKCITGYNTKSFFGGRISHLSIQFTGNNQKAATRPIIVEALTTGELNKLLAFLDTQIAKV